MLEGWIPAGKDVPLCKLSDNYLCNHYNNYFNPPRLSFYFDFTTIRWDLLNLLVHAWQQRCKHAFQNS